MIIKFKYGTDIPFERITYGELASCIRNTAIEICENLKMERRLKKKLKFSRKDLRDFCEQYEMDMGPKPVRKKEE